MHQHHAPAPHTSTLTSVFTTTSIFQMISSDDNDFEDNKKTRSKSQDMDPDASGSERNTRVRVRDHTTPTRRLRQRRASEVSEAVITSPRKVKITDDERREKNRIRQQKCRAKKNSEEKAADNKAANIRMSKRREKFPESNKVAVSKHREKFPESNKSTVNKHREIFPESNKATVAKHFEKFPELNKATVYKHREKFPESNKATVSKHREEFPESNRATVSQHRANQSNEKRESVRRSDRLRKAQLKESMTEDEQAEERERTRIRVQTHRILKETKVNEKDGLRSAEVLDGTFNVKLLENSLDSIGTMDELCTHCGAFKFRKETPGFCCSSGKVHPAPFPRPPDKMMNLWEGNGMQANLLKQFSREINNAVCLASIQVTEKVFRRFTPSVIFQGQVIQRAGALQAEDGETPRFSQLYCIDKTLEETQRFENMILSSSVTNSQKQKLKDLLKMIQNVIHEHNPFVNDFKQILEMPAEELKHGKIVISAKAKPANEHPRRYNAPTNLNEISILTNEARHDLVLQLRGGGLQKISDLNPKGMPLRFTLLFPYGTYGWDPESKHTNGVRKITTREFFAFHLQIRNNENKNFLHVAGRLFQEYVCVAWVQIESQRLLYQTLNQKALRADSYKNVRQATEERINDKGARADQMYHDDHNTPKIGRKILASSFTGSPRWYNSKFQDAMAICRKYRKPDIFLTMTCNPHWPEIQEGLLGEKKPQDRPDLISRVFKLKKDQLLKDVIKGGIFGKISAFMYVIEWQKRGLPHSHFLFILENESRLDSPKLVDNAIVAELPPNPQEVDDLEQRESRSRLEQIVLTNMVHGPCGEANPHSPCMENGRCTKGYPKEFMKETVVDPNNHYATYRRRCPADGGRTMKHPKMDGKMIDNRWVVPYNPYLSQKYNCHINMESCASEKCTKYLFKYVTKGNDRVAMRAEVDDAIDEIQEYQDLRSVSSSEAAWHIFGFPITDRFPSVLAMRVHLEEQQEIIFDENTEMEALENQRETELTAFFAFNAKELLSGADPEDLPRYVDMPEMYRYNKSAKKWVKRKIQNMGNERVIGRVHAINPVAGEVYYLRMLLHTNHCRGKVSFQDMKVLQGKVCETFKEVCSEIGLLKDDKEWQRVLEEAAATKMSPQIRELYVIILMFCLPSDPLALFNEFWESWYDDFEIKAAKKNIKLSPEQLKIMVLLDIESRLESYEETLTKFGLPTPSKEERDSIKHLHNNQSALIRAELDFDVQELESTVQLRLPTFTEEQSSVFQTIVEAVNNGDSLQVFIDARGGCGKTYLLNTILAKVRSLDGGCVAVAMATTGIAANLLSLGRTFHSRLKAPLKPDENSTLKITAQSELAKLIKKSKLFLIDEATMLNRFLLEAFDRTLRDLMVKPHVPFGGKIVILAGDFRQCLPVVKGATRPGIVNQSVNQSHLWKSFKILQLSQNMRVRASGDPDLEAFDKWTLSIGDGKVDKLDVPANMIATKITPYSKENSTSEGQAMENFCDKIFPNIENNIIDRSFCDGRAILAATNKEVEMLNDIITAKLPGTLTELRSADELDNTEDLLRFNSEYLNTLTPNGFPPHALRLKAGMVLMLLRNLNPSEGLCNGTKMVFETILGNKLLQCRLAGSERTVFIPRYPG